MVDSRVELTMEATQCGVQKRKEVVWCGVERRRDMMRRGGEQRKQCGVELRRGEK